MMLQQTWPKSLGGKEQSDFQWTFDEDDNEITMVNYNYSDRAGGGLYLVRASFLGFFAIHWLIDRSLTDPMAQLTRRMIHMLQAALC
jgi:hypothetical protein